MANSHENFPIQFNRESLIALLRNGEMVQFVEAAKKIMDEYVAYLEQEEISPEDHQLIFDFIFSHLQLTEKDLDTFNEFVQQVEDFSSIPFGANALKIQQALQHNFTAQLLNEKGFVHQYPIITEAKQKDREKFLKKFFAKFKLINENYQPLDQLTIANKNNLDEFKALMASTFGEGVVEIALYKYLIEQYRQRIASEPQMPSDEVLFEFIRDEYSKFRASYDELFKSTKRLNPETENNAKTKEWETFQKEMLYRAYEYYTTRNNQINSEREKDTELLKLKEEVSKYKDDKNIGEDEKKKREKQRAILADVTSNILDTYVVDFIQLVALKIPPKEIPQFLDGLPNDEFTPLFQDKNFREYLEQIASELRRYSGSNFAAELFFSEEKEKHGELVGKLQKYKRKTINLERTYDSLREKHRRKHEADYKVRQMQQQKQDQDFLRSLVIETSPKQIPEQTLARYQSNASFNNYLVALAKHIQDLNDPASDTFYRVHLARQHRNALKAFQNSGFPNAKAIADDLEKVYAEKAQAASALNYENVKKAWRFLWTDDPKEPVWKAMLMLPKKTNSTKRNIFNAVMYGLFLVLGGIPIIAARIILKSVFEGGALGAQKLFGTAITAIDKRFGVNPASSALMGLVGIFYSAAKGFRVVLRALTSPIRSGTEAFKTGSVVDRRLGIAMAFGSGLLSAAWAVALSYFVAFGATAGAAAVGSTPVVGPAITGVLKGIALFGAKLVSWTNAAVSLAGLHPLATAFSVAGLSVEPALAVGTAVLAVSLPFMRKVADLAVDGILFAAKSLFRGLKALGQKLTGKKSEQSVIPAPAVAAPATVVLPPPVNPPSQGSNTNDINNGMQETGVVPKPAATNTKLSKDEIDEVLGQQVPKVQKGEIDSPDLTRSLSQVGFSEIHHKSDPHQAIVQYQDIKAAVTKVNEILGTTDAVEITPALKDVKPSFQIAKDVDIQPLLDKLQNKVSYQHIQDDGKHVLVFDDAKEFQAALEAVKGRSHIFSH